MARPFTLTERNTAKAGHVWHLSRCEVLDVDDTWQDLTDLGPDGVATYLGATISTGVDANVWQATVRVRLSYGAESLSPLMASSVFNVDGVLAYAPLLNAGTRIRLYAKTALPTDTLGSITDYLVFDGRIDRPTFTVDPMVLTCRDLGGKLIDTILRTERTYGDADNPPTDAEVIQQLLTDNADLLGESITLVDDSAVPFFITKQVAYGASVMDAITLVASLSGKVVRYKFQADGTFKLTLYDPIRDAVTADYTLEPTEYLAVDDSALDFTSGRNFIRVWWNDGVSGENLSIDVSDSGSILAFGEKFMQLGGEQLAAITNGTDALALAQFALDDLSTPLFDHTAKNTFTWFAEIGDYVGFTGDNVHFDEEQALGLVNIVHEFPDGGQGAATSAFQCRGQPAGAYTRWLRLQGGPIYPQIPPAPTLMFLLGEETQFGGTVETVDGAVWLGYRMPVGVDEIRVHVLRGDGPLMPVPNIDGTTHALTIRRPEGDIGTPPTGVVNQFPNEPGEYASLALMSLLPGWWKRIIFYGVRGGLTSVPVIPRAVQAVDPIPTAIDGTIASISVVRAGSTNTVTVTPGTLDSGPTTDANWLCIMRNKHILPPYFIRADTTPIVFVDSGLPASGDYEAVYDAFIWNNSGTSGTLRRTIATAPTTTPPAWALGTPVTAIQANVTVVQLSWVGTTPGATGVRVEASLDRVATRSVGTGSLANGTVYDADPTPKLYRLVATNGATNVAFSDWYWFTGLPTPVSNPSALPQFINDTPRAVLSGLPAPQLRLAISWRCATPGARLLRIQESDDNGVGDPWALVTNGESASVALGTWQSPSDAAVYIDRWYRLQALTAAGAVLATSASRHYIPPP